LYFLSPAIIIIQYWFFFWCCFVYNFITYKWYMEFIKTKVKHLQA